LGGRGPVALWLQSLVCIRILLQSAVPHQHTPISLCSMPIHTQMMMHKPYSGVCGFDTCLCVSKRSRACDQKLYEPTRT